MVWPSSNWDIERATMHALWPHKFTYSMIVNSRWSQYKNQKVLSLSRWPFSQFHPFCLSECPKRKTFRHLECGIGAKWENSSGQSILWEYPRWVFILNLSVAEVDFNPVFMMTQIPLKYEVFYGGAYRKQHARHEQLITHRKLLDAIWLGSSWTAKSDSIMGWRESASMNPGWKGGWEFFHRLTMVSQQASYCLSELRMTV